MSCLSDCGCKRSEQEIETAEDRTAHVESSYQPLLEASNTLEAIPLLPKDPAMHKYEAQQQQYQLIALIGESLNQTAEISLAMHMPSKRHVAVRRIDLERCSEDISYIQKEIILTRQLSHENLLPYFSTFVSGCHVWAVMPLMNFGSARSLLKSSFPDGLPEIAVAFILKDVINALIYLHKRGFIHRSIRASHILLNHAGRAILGGIRYSCNVFQSGRWQSSVHSYPHDATPNLKWLSPELLHQNLMGYSAKSDVYSLGITALELRSGVVPFAHLLPTEMLLEKLADASHQHHSFGHNTHVSYSTKENNSVLLVDSNGGQVLPNQRQNQENHMSSLQVKKACNQSANNSMSSNSGSVITSQGYSEAFATFVQMCLAKDPLQRPPSALLLNHSFIKKCKKSQISLLDILGTASQIVETYEKNTGLEEEDDVVPIDRLQTFEIEDYWSF